MSPENFLIVLVLIAGFYMAWSIGANDVANAMGTSVGSKALSLRNAVIVAAVLEFSGAFFFGSHVSETVQKGIIDSDIFAHNPLTFVYGMLAALIATGAWLQIASYKGWPVSTTHSIIGALVGFGAVIGGIEAIYWRTVAFIVISWILSPFLGGVIAYLIFNTLLRKILYQKNPVQAAIRFCPILIFLVFTILSLMMMFKGLQNLPIHLSFFGSLFLSAGIGAVFALIGYVLIRRMRLSPPQQEILAYDMGVLRGLHKAKKHLMRAQTTSSGELQEHINTLVEEVDTLTATMKTPEQLEHLHAEYSGVERIFSYLQIVTACLMAFSHGANDVANAIGPIAATLDVLRYGAIATEASIPTWVLGLGGVGIVFGLATWGWRVIETIGRKITELTPTRGFAAEFGAALTILVASRLGLPISTTHTLVGAVIGVGLARGIEALNLNTTRDIFISWIVTVPAGAIITVVFYYAIKLILG